MLGSRNPRVQYRCSFCGKSQEHVHRLIAGPGGVYICNECVDLCDEIIREEATQAGTAGAASTSEQQRGSRLMSTVRDIRGHVATGDYETAVTKTETLLEGLRELRDSAPHS